MDWLSGWLVGWLGDSQSAFFGVCQVVLVVMAATVSVPWSGGLAHCGSQSAFLGVSCECTLVVSRRRCLCSEVGR